MGRLQDRAAVLQHGRPPTETTWLQCGPAHPTVIEGAAAGDKLGHSVGGGFDVNGDGVVDALVGAPFAETLIGTPTNAGEAYVISPFQPDEVLGLTLSQSGAVTELEWRKPHRALGYNVYRGELDQMVGATEIRTSTMCAAPSPTCAIECAITTDADSNGLPDTTDADTPGDGETFFYLVTGISVFGEGPLAPDTASPPRINDLQCP